MAGTKENFHSVIRPSKIQGGSKEGSENFTAVIGKNRRALSTINGNIIGAPPYVHKRRVLKEEKINACSTTNPWIPVHRPVTRKFAAQLAVKEHHHPSLEAAKPSVQPKSSTHQLGEDYIIIDGDGYTAMDVHHDVFVQNAEEIDKMDVEVEMQDIDGDEAVADIDSADNKNPLAVAEYIDDIYEYYKRNENKNCVPPTYMAHQFDINERMRAILIDWLIEVHYKFELMEETLYLMVNIIDRFLAIQPVLRKKLQLVGVTAMLLACKYEEVSVPIVDDLIVISDNAYCRKEILDMEKMMINTLQFNLSVPTPYSFMRRFLKAAQSDKTLELLSFFIVELCLVEYEMLRFSPSLLAAAAVFTAQCTLSGSKQWSKTCMSYTSYSQDQLIECAKLMVGLHRKAGKEKLIGVHKKYSCPKYGCAAKTEPALFLIDAAGFY
ncbi:hypothetical protein OROGR_026108 [Orobanche gracilis]